MVHAKITKKTPRAHKMKKISEEIIDSTIKIHKNLGPGLLESVYQNCLFYELNKKGIPTEKEVILSVAYEDMIFESGFRADVIVDKKVIIEIKSTEKIQPVHKAQTLTYLKLSKLPLALLINFGDNMLKSGISRFANGEGANDL